MSKAILFKKIVKELSIVIFLVLTVFAGFALQGHFVKADPPTPQNIFGKVFNNDSSGAPNFIPVYVENVNLSQIFYTQVYAPPIPSLAGSYSLTINGSLGDTIRITSYNSSNYGNITTTISSSGSTNANLTLNTNRPAEINLSIIQPGNNSNYAIGEFFNVTVNMTVNYTTGIACNITLNITDSNIINFSAGFNATNLIGDITPGTYVSSIFQLQTNTSGAVNITATGVCANSFYYFNIKSADTIFDITSTDQSDPIVTLIYPNNNTENKSSNNILFMYNVTDSSNISNCSIYINDAINYTNNSILKDTSQDFYVYLDNANYSWFVSCFDDEGNQGNSSKYLLNLSVYYPVVINISTTQNIVLNAGGTKKVYCNFTVEDGNGAADIVSVNSTFHRANVSSDLGANNNYLYRNASCQNIGNLGNISEYTCEFYLEYYSNNGTWTCNVSSTDISELMAYNESNTTIDPLYALNLSRLFIDYGNIAIDDYSSEESIDITNFGNQNLNISVKGYGGVIEAVGAGTAMLCAGGDNISIDSQRFAASSGIAFTSKKPLAAINQDLGITISKQTNPITQQTAPTYWQLYVEPVTLNVCNGTIVFTAGAE